MTTIAQQLIALEHQAQNVRARTATAEINGHSVTVKLSDETKKYRATWAVDNRALSYPVVSRLFNAAKPVQGGTMETLPNPEYQPAHMTFPGTGRFGRAPSITPDAQARAIEAFRALTPAQQAEFFVIIAHDDTMPANVRAVAAGRPA